MLHELPRRVACLAIVFLAGCIRTTSVNLVEKFSDDHGFVDGKNADQLAGPYEYVKVLSPNLMVIAQTNGEFRFHVKGLGVTGDTEFNGNSAKELTTWVALADMYVLKESVTRTESGEMSGILYKSTTQYCTGIDPATDKLTYYIANYMMIQLPMLLYGNAVLDKTDTNYAQYPIFLEAENLAKKHKRGYWKTHTE